jgi:hypothetical protein
MNLAIADSFFLSRPRSTVALDGASAASMGASSVE